jgi:dehydrogenase/reductase SDR family protein 12
VGFWDDLLDKSIIFSFGHFGFKRHSRDFAALLDNSLQGKHFLITGGSSGIGSYVALCLLDCDARVTIISRSKPNISHANMHYIQMDLADYRMVSRKILDVSPVDVLINNAGGMPSYHCREKSISEDIFASQVLGHYALIQALIEQKKLQDKARVIFVSSGGMYLKRLDLSDLRFEICKFNKYTAYANAKRAQVILNELFAEKFHQYNWSCMHPGWVDTGGVKKGMPWFYYLMYPFLRTLAEGADTILYLATSDDHLPSGKFWFDRKVVPCHLFPQTVELKDERDELWHLCEVANASDS